MSSLDLELDGVLDDLQLEWREAHEASIIARAEYLALGAYPEVNADALKGAGERLRRAEAMKSRIFAKIESLEDSMLGLS
ncbi:MAG TPA: hypothetical protein VK743_07570 [Steroidobacteraceae bacterium]|jgi:hypothetical protein|nr:hypothetical protein [Steroidobacteraceae bacterium]